MAGAPPSQQAARQCGAAAAPAAADRCKARLGRRQYTRPAPIAWSPRWPPSPGQRQLTRSTCRICTAGLICAPSRPSGARSSPFPLPLALLPLPQGPLEADESRQARDTARKAVRNLPGGCGGEAAAPARRQGIKSPLGLSLSILQHSPTAHLASARLLHQTSPTKSTRHRCVQHPTRRRRLAAVPPLRAARQPRPPPARLPNQRAAPPLSAAPSPPAHPQPANHGVPPRRRRAARRPAAVRARAPHRRRRHRCRRRGRVFRAD